MNFFSFCLAKVEEKKIERKGSKLKSRKNQFAVGARAIKFYNPATDGGFKISGLSSCFR